MEEPLISVVIPVYNMEQYLARCLDSVLNNTYRNLEVLCVDDGSRDRSLEILREYEKRDSRIIVIAKENGGVSSARNAGLDRMTGELVESEIEIELPGIMPGTYVGAEFHEIGSSGANQWHDFIQNMLQIEILENREIIPGGAADHTNKIPWNHNMWGSSRLPS